MKVKLVQREGNKADRPLNNFGGWFKPGNECAKAENLTPEGNNRRLQALFRGWETRRKVKEEGLKMTTDRRRKLKKRRRTRLRITVAKEAREIQVIARQNAVAAMEKLAEIAATSVNESAVIQAINVILERAYGKASQTQTNVNIDANGKAKDVTDTEIDQRIATALKRIEELAGRKTKALASPPRPPDVCVDDRDPDSTTRH